MSEGSHQQASSPPSEFTYKEMIDFCRLKRDISGLNEAGFILLTL